MAALQASDYDALGLPHRVALLHALCHLAMDCPTVRETLERRLEEQGRIKRQVGGLYKELLSLREACVAATMAEGRVYWLLVLQPGVQPLQFLPCTAN